MQQDNLIQFDEEISIEKQFPPIVYIGDCREILPKLKTDFQLIITSPPYDAEKAYEGKRDLQLYTDFAKEWMAEIPRILSDGGSFWLNVGYTKIGENETLPLSYIYYDVKPTELKLIQEIVWHYEGGMSYKKRFSHRTERWLWFALQPENVTFHLDDVRDASLNRTQDNRNNPAGKNPTDYWYFNRVVGGRGKTTEKTNHPCQFPEAMIERIIKACSSLNDAILDPFAGSGTVGRVAMKFGRQATLIEKNPEYL